MAYDVNNKGFYSLQEQLETQVKSYNEANSLKSQLRNYIAHSDSDLSSLQEILDDYDSLVRDWDYHLSFCHPTAQVIENADYHKSETGLYNRITYLRNEYIKTRNIVILIEISNLIGELYRRITLYAGKHKINIKYLHRNIKNSVKRDLRLCYRNIIRFLFKNMSDTSGSDSAFLFHKKSRTALNHFQFVFYESYFKSKTEYVRAFR